jgi:phosphatidylinositol alpha-mannosyltransferase
MEVVRHRRLPDGRLLRRRYEEHLTHVPLSWRSLRQGADDVVHAFHHADAQAAIRSGRPAVYSYLGVPHRTGLANRRLRLDLVMAAIDRSAVTLALSEAAAREFRRWLGVDPQVIHPGVDLDAFTLGGERAEAFTVVCPAALGEPQKRAALLRDAFAIVRRERPGARLVVQRGGPLDAEPGVEPRDLDDHAALVGAYREAHVTALASRGEAFGLVLAESLACGTPAVACTDAAGPEVIGDAGATFDGDDPRALAAAILDAAAVSEQACRARAERFSLDRCVDAHERLYASLLT